MSAWTQDHYVTRNSTTDDPSGYRVWLTCRCGWDSGTLVDGFLPTTHRAELEHYVSVAPLAEVRRQAAEEALLKAEDAVSELIDGYESTADEMRGRSECVDSNRYSNYAAGLSMAAGSIRTLAAEYRKEETE